MSPMQNLQDHDRPLRATARCSFAPKQTKALWCALEWRDELRNVDVLGRSGNTNMPHDEDGMNNISQEAHNHAELLVAESGPTSEADERCPPSRRAEMVFSCKDAPTGLFVITFLAIGLNRADAILSFLDVAPRGTVDIAFSQPDHADGIAALFSQIAKGAQLNNTEVRVAGSSKPWLQSSGGLVGKQPALLEGDRALHVAARFGSDMVVAGLLMEGADDFLVNNAGQTPLDIAAAGGPGCALVWKLLSLTRACRSMGIRADQVGALWQRAGSQLGQAPNPFVVTTPDETHDDRRALSQAA